MIAPPEMPDRMAEALDLLSGAAPCAVERASQLFEEAVSAVIGALAGDGTRQARCEAAQVLEHTACWWDEAFTGNAGIMASPTGRPDVVDRLECWGQVQAARAVQPLLCALKDPDIWVSDAAQRALGAIGDARAVGPLIEYLGDTDSHVRAGAAAALGEIGAVLAVEPLIGCLEDADMRGAVAHALAHLRDARATEPLARCLTDSDPEVRAEVANALGCIRDRRAVEALVGCLTDEDASVRWQAAMGLGNIGDPRALPALAEAIRTDPGSSLLRGLMVEALGYMGGAGAIEALITVLKTDEPEVRRSVPRALYLTGDAEALKACMGAALEVGDEEAHRSAADLLSDLSDEDELQRLREERTHGFLSPYWQED